MQTQNSRKRIRFLVASLLFTFIILMSESLWAPPPRPGPRKPPRKPAKPPAARAKPLPRRVKPPRFKPRPVPRARYVRQRRYWYPRYVYPPKRARWVWRSLGYRYYLGGSKYVVTDDTTAPEVDLKNDENAIERYGQIQELFELIYEWRTLNESPELHKRLPEENAATEKLTTVKKIRILNQQFDQVTRQGMAEFALGNSANEELKLAKKHLTILTELVESLPGV